MFRFVVDKVPTSYEDCQFHDGGGRHTTYCALNKPRLVEYSLRTSGKCNILVEVDQSDKGEAKCLR